MTAYVCYNNHLASARYAIGYSLQEVVGFPLSNAWTWDMLRPARMTPSGTTAEILLGVPLPAVGREPDTIIFGSHRHDVAGRRSDNVQRFVLSYYDGVSGQAPQLLATTLRGSAVSSLHTFQAVRPYPDIYYGNSDQKTTPMDSLLFAPDILDLSLILGAGSPNASIRASTATVDVSTGTGWKSRTLPFSFAVYRAEYARGRFFLLGSDGSNGLLAYSTTGMGSVWADAGSGLLTTSILSDIAWGTTFYMVIDRAGNSWISGSGTSWTAQSNTGLTTWCLGLAYGAGLFVAVGKNASGQHIATSTNGATWTARTSGLPAGATLYDVEYHATTDPLNPSGGTGLFVAVGTGGHIITSSDGITWTSQTSGTSNNLYRIKYGDRWMAVSAAGEAVHSPDGATWTVTATGLDTCSDVYWAGDRWVALGTVGGVAYLSESTDANTWTLRQAPAAGTLYGTSNGVFDVIAQRVNTTACYAATRLSVYRLVLYLSGTGDEVVLPELFLGDRIELPAPRYAYDPYTEVFRGQTFESRNGRIYTQLQFRRVEVKPRFLIQGTAAADVELFREEHLEHRKPFFFAWDPVNEPTAVYMVRHRGDQAPFPYSVRDPANASRALRTLELDLVEAV